MRAVKILWILHSAQAEHAVARVAVISLSVPTAVLEEPQVGVHGCACAHPQMIKDKLFHQILRKEGRSIDIEGGVLARACKMSRPTPREKKRIPQAFQSAATAVVRWYSVYEQRTAQSVRIIEEEAGETGRGGETKTLRRATPSWQRPSSLWLFSKERLKLACLCLRAFRILRTVQGITG